MIGEFTSEKSGSSVNGLAGRASESEAAQPEAKDGDTGLALNRGLHSWGVWRYPS